MSFAKTMDKITGLDTGEYDHRHAGKSQGQGCTGKGCICCRGADGAGKVRKG
jgi:hypothetical protein